MANTIVCLSIASAYRFWFSVLGRIVRPRADRMPTVSTSAGRTPRSARSMAAVRSTASAVRSVPLRSSSTSSANSAGTRAGPARGPGLGELVAPDVDVGVEFPLNHVQQLVPGTEQADHRMIGRDHDLHLRS